MNTVVIFADMPRMYSTTKAQRDAMSPEEQDAIWAEYREYWKGYEGHNNRRSDIQFDTERDWDERGITARDAYNDEHPRQSGGERV